MILRFCIPLVFVFVELSAAQLNLPDMPGPPYPDKFGNNRWGVKYDPKLHNPRYRSQSPSAAWGGDSPEFSPSVRYNRPSQAQPSTRSKWTAALKPLVSRTRISRFKSKRNRRPVSSPFHSTSDNFYKPPKTQFTTKAIDSYVKNYMSTYNKVSQLPFRSSLDLSDIKNFARPINKGRRFRPWTFEESDNKKRRHDSVVSKSASVASTGGSLRASYFRAVTNDTKPLYRTLDPQNDFFGPKLSKKSDFAKTLSNIYNDYNPGDENKVGSGAQSSSGILSSSLPADSINSITIPDDDNPSFSYKSYPPKNPYYKVSKPKTHSSSAGPLSSHDLHGETISYSTGSDPAEVAYPDPPPSPMIVTNNGGGGDDVNLSTKFLPNSFSPSSSGPVTVSSYSSGPSYSYPYASDSNDGHNRPISSSVSLYPASISSSALSAPLLVASPLGVSHVSAPTPVLTPVAPISYLPSANIYYPPTLYTLSPTSTSNNNKKTKKSKRKKTRFQHTPMNVLRGLLGRSERRDRNRDGESAFAANYPLTLPAPVPPHQYNLSPYVNTLSSVDYRAQPSYSAGGLPPPPPPPPPHYSPLNAGLSNLRESLNGYNKPLPLSSQRYPSATSVVAVSTEAEPGKLGAHPSGPITQHLQDWPRIFTAMGSSVDAVAGGIHAVRKEISKMTGKTVAKGILMGGSAVHEVSKGMAQVIQKMSAI